MKPRVDLDREKLAAFCRKWEICELALFGSALRDDFRPDSDLDFLVTFAPSATWSLLDHAAMERELSELTGRPVDLVSKRAIERSHNWIRRRSILESAQVLYAA
jgi:uncharacterized protein